MASEVAICNEALIKLGQNVITSLSDNVKTARLCNTIFDEKRDELLRKYDWKFAIKRTITAPDVTVPAFEYTYQHTIPSDNIRLISVSPTADHTECSYRIESNKILCDHTALYIKYIYRVTDPNQMDVAFRAVLSAVLAQHLAIPLTDSQTKLKIANDWFDEVIEDAYFQDSIEYDYTEELETDDWINSRY